MRQQSGSHYRQNAWKNVEGNSPVNYTFGVEGNNVDRHARLLHNSNLPLTVRMGSRS